jgi:hypothetical protein
MHPRELELRFLIQNRKHLNADFITWFITIPDNNSAINILPTEIRFGFLTHIDNAQCHTVRQKNQEAVADQNMIVLLRMHVMLVPIMI